MSDIRQKKVCDTITMSSELLDKLTEEFSPCAEENTPGLRLMDRYPDRVQLDDFDPKDEDALSKRRSLLNTV